MFLYTSRIQSHVDSPSCKRHVHGHVHCTRAGTASTRTVHGRLSLYPPVHGPLTAVHSCIRVHGHYTALFSPCTQPKKAVCTAVYTARTPPCTRAVSTACTRPCTCSCTRAVYKAAYTTRRVYGTCTYTSVYTGLHGPLRAYTRADTARTWPCTRARSRPCRCTRVYVYTSHIHGPCARPVHGPSFTWHVHGR